MDDLLRQIRDDPRIRAAERSVSAGDARTLSDQVLLTRIPAPPFAEEARGRRMASLMAEAGLENVTTDGIGNVLGRFEGASEGPPIVLSAHLDTVFPAETPIEVKVTNSRRTYRSRIFTPASASSPPQRPAAGIRAGCRLIQVIVG